MNFINKMLYTFRSNIVIKTLLLFLIINCLSVLGLFLYMPRAIFYFEYALVLFLIIYFNKPKLAYVVFVILLLLDFLDAFSSVYLFNVFEFLRNAKYLFLYKISFFQILMVLVFIIALIIIYKLIIKLNSRIQKNKKNGLRTLLFVYTLIFVLDLFNGSNKITDNHTTWKISNTNIASFITKNYIYYFEQLFSINTNKVSKYTEESPVFSYFKNDNKNNEMVIIVESWGLINDSTIRNNVRQFINQMIVEKGFRSQWGTTSFTGSTTSAALKQFLNLKGYYNYFLNKTSLSTGDTSLFDIKNLQGYHTSAFHAYTGKMFSRSTWCPNIGIQNVYFRENYIAEHLNEPNSIQEESPFPAIKDELMFDYLLNKTSGPQKEFTYFLTVNSHLPFRYRITSGYPSLTNQINGLQISDEAKSQLMFIYEQLYYYIDKLSKSKYNRIIIMGDHVPPYMNIQDRHFYNNLFVPYLYLTRD